jgi:hypothetical protein
VMLLDETTQRFHRILLQEYLATPHLQDFHSMRIWKGIHEHTKVQAEAYGMCAVDCMHPDNFLPEFRNMIPVIHVRLIRSIAEQMKLELMRYIEVEPEIWNQLYSAYRLAESSQLENTMVYAYPGQAIQTSPRHELLRALVLYISSPDTLSPDQIEVAYRIAARMAGFFDMQENPTVDCHNFIDLASSAAPGSVDANLHASPTLRYFGMQHALSKVKEIIQVNESGRLQHEKRFGNEFTPDGKLTVLRHLERYWANEHPHRRNERSNIHASIEVVHGYETLLKLVAHISAEAMRAPSEKDAASHNARSDNPPDDESFKYTPETWPMLDASGSGLGTIMPAKAGSWAKIGSLFGIKTRPGHPWWIGVIRRMKTEAGDEVHVGIEILARKPLSAWLRILIDGTDKASDWQSRTDSLDYDYLHVILLSDSHNSYLNATLLMKPRSYAANQVYEIMMGDNSRSIQLTGLLAEDEDYEQVSFKWLDASQR